jgi:hypothetical protein
MVFPTTVGEEMLPTDMQTFLRTRPFHPFRVVMLDGVTYEVRHPELVLLLLDSAVIGYPAPGQEGVAQRADMINLQAVSRLELVDQAAPAVPGNGNAS